MRKGLKSTSVLVTTLLFLAQFVFLTTTAKAEDCPKYDLPSLFAEEFYPDIKWDNSSGLKVIKWSPFPTAIKGVPIARPFTAQELVYLQTSWDAWDVALSTFTFVRVDDPAQADVIVGYTPINENGFWTVESERNDKGVLSRVSGTIRISSTTPIVLTKEGFIEVAQSEIGNLLGLGDIQKTIETDSIMLDPDLPPFGESALNDFDISLIRQLYGESTCKSAWPAELVAAKAKLAEEKAAALKAAQEKADAEAKAKAEAEAAAAAKAKAEADAKARAELGSKSGSSAKKITITCVKGKTVKKVTAVKPKCPAGFKKK